MPPEIKEKLKKEKTIPPEIPSPHAPPDVPGGTPPDKTKEKEKPTAPSPLKTEPMEKPEEKTTPPLKKEEKAKEEEKEAPAELPCKPRLAPASCDRYGRRGDLRAVLFAYYCHLANHELDQAFAMWAIAKDKGWFYESSANFCSVDDFLIRNVTPKETAENTATVTYTVDLLDEEGRVIETRDMKATFIKRAGKWFFRTNLRRQPQP